MNDDYKEALAESCMAIATARQEIFSALINVAMSGEYAEIDDIFEVGETVLFDTTYFQHSQDSNLKKLLELVYHLEQTHDTLTNINGLGNSEYN